RRRDRPRRSAALSLPHLGRVGASSWSFVADTRPAARGAPVATRRPPPRKAKPEPRFGADLLDAKLIESGLTAANVLSRAGQRLGFYRVRDLLFHLPKRYDDLRELRRLGELQDVDDGEVVSARVQVRDLKVEQTFRRRVQRTIAYLGDETGEAEAT